MPRSRPLPLAVLLVLCAGAAAAQTPATAPAATDAVDARELDLVVVTGSRSNRRTVRDSLSPIDVLPLEAVQSSGTAELNVALSRLLPSFNFARTSISDGSDTVRPAQLRGLSPDQLLVLVDGKRRHSTALVNVNGTQGRGSSPVDLNAIPMHAIERIEVLRDGAAALYGSDAIAGVINVVLKRGDGGSADLRAGQYDEGDGEMLHLGADAGFPIAADGWLHVAAEFRDRAATNRAGPDLRDPREPTFGTVNHAFGDSDSEDRMLFANSAVPLGDAIELYGFASASDRRAIHAGFYRRAFDARNLAEIYPAGFLPQFDNDSEDRSLLLGLRGATTGGLAWDLSANHGSNEFAFNVFNSLNTSLGAASPTEFFAGRLHNEQQLLNLDFQHALDLGLPDLLSLAFGAELRREEYRIGAGDEASYIGSGAQVFPGFRPSDAGRHDRHSRSLYVELETDFSERLSASLAARHEDYSDFGSTTSGKLSARYAASDAFALRGTVSTGFRAPSLAQQFYATTATNFINGEPFEIRTFGVDDPVAIALGAEPLQAEESTSLSLGLQWSPTPSLYVTVDAYRIDIDDRIELSENLTGAAVREFLAASGFANTDGGRYFTNAVDTRTRGIDLLATWKLELDAAALDLTISANATDTDVTRIAPNPPILAGSGLDLQRIGRVQQGRIEAGTPENKLLLSADYRQGPWRFVATATRWGEVTELNVLPANDQTYGVETTLDLALSWSRNAFTATVGSDNVTDEYPDRVIAANSFSGILPYSRGTTPFGFNGRFWYARAGWRW